MATNENELESNESFEQRIFNTVQSGFLTVCLSVGRATGLFNTMAKLGEPRSSHDIAQSAGLKERYVREWLGAMVTGRIIDVNPTNDTYYLQPHRAETLCNPSTMIFSEAIPALCEVYSDILECMKTDGPRGVSYSKYNLFQQWLETKEELRLGLLPSKYLSNILEVKTLLESSAMVCEIGCAGGFGLCQLARDYPTCTYHGLDISKPFIDNAKMRASSMNLQNVTFHVSDATKMSDAWTGKYDVVYCFDVVHDVPRADLILQEIHRVLKDDGYFVMVENKSYTKHADNIPLPMAPALYTVSLFACMPTSLYYDGGLGLGAAWGVEKAKEMLNEVEFDCFSITDTANKMYSVYTCKKKLSK
ncbi:S-adenosylmethionine-dependent methyltransferase Rv2258c-like [Saccoglossus kowalevskii]